MRLLAIDPGTTHSGFVVLNTVTYTPEFFGKWENRRVAEVIMRNLEYDEIVLEQIVLYGNAGKTTADTLEWIGRFKERAEELGHTIHLLSRQKVKNTLLGKLPQKKKGDPSHDSLVRKYVIEALHPLYDLHHNPGPLQGITEDIWQACGLALAYLKLEDAKPTRRRRNSDTVK